MRAEQAKHARSGRRIEVSSHPRPTRRRGSPTSPGHRPAGRCPDGHPPIPPATPAPTPTPPTPAAEPGGPPDPGDPLAQLPEVLTVREVAAILRVGRNQLYQAVARGELPAVRIGRTIRIPKAALARPAHHPTPTASSGCRTEVTRAGGPA